MSGVLAGTELTQSVDLLFQKRYSYDGDNVEYIGLSEPGELEGALSWLITKFTYVDGKVTESNLASDDAAMDKSWTDRASYF